MGGASFVAGDWGTSNLRLFLCDADGAALDQLTGPGVAEVAGSSGAAGFADTFDSLTAPWQAAHAVLPAVLCGMVGSSIGWIQAPYVPCPAMPEQIIDACTALPGARIHIVPGLSCRNRFNAPDFMRGEETQILGALTRVPELSRGTRLLCLPGTHTKWVVLVDGLLRDFFTAPSGELFALLCEHSVLVRKPKGDAPADLAAFQAGLARFNEFPNAQLLHRLFECRSRQLSGELAAQSADAYLSGLLIASDVHGALGALSGAVAERSVCLIGTDRLLQLYALALQSHGFAALPVEGAAAALAGLSRVQQRLTLAQHQVTHGA
ncbi:MAG TPA: 2-dehydro-3-deoxygalactonokinase [Steroidobacteraceae bacterium]